MYEGRRSEYIMGKGTHLHPPNPRWPLPGHPVLLAADDPGCDDPLRAHVPGRRRCVRGARKCTLARRFRNLLAPRTRRRCEAFGVFRSHSRTRLASHSQAPETRFSYLQTHRMHMTPSLPTRAWRRVRSQCRFRHKATESVRESAIERTSGTAKWRCGRSLA